MATRRATRTDQLIALVAVALVVVGCFMVMRPFLSSLMWAVVLTFSCWPFHRRLLALVGGRKTLAASLMTLAITFILLVPSVIIGITLVDNARDFGLATVKWMNRGLPEAPDWLKDLPFIGVAAADYWSRVSSDGTILLRELDRFVEPATGWVVRGSVAIGRGVLDLALSIFLAFFFFRDGARLGEGARAVAARLGAKRGIHLLQDVAGGTVRSVVYGILGTAVVQALVAGIGFAIAGVPGAALLALFTFFLSVVPMGPPLVWLPAALWLYQNSSPGWAIFMIAWGLLVSSVDNLVRPLIIVQANRMPFVLIFLGVIGGALAFGLIGVFLGPSLIAVCFSLLVEWIAVRRGATTVSQDGPGPELNGEPALEAEVPLPPESTLKAGPGSFP